MQLSLDLPVGTSAHSGVCVTFRSATWSSTTTLDNSHRSVSVDLPDGLAPADVEAFMEFIDNRGEIDVQAGKRVLKTILRPRRGKQPRGK